MNSMQFNKKKDNFTKRAIHFVETALLLGDLADQTRRVAHVDLVPG